MVAKPQCGCATHATLARSFLGRTMTSVQHPVGAEDAQRVHQETLKGPRRGFAQRAQERNALFPRWLCLVSCWKIGDPRYRSSRRRGSLAQSTVVHTPGCGPWHRPAAACEQTAMSISTNQHLWCGLPPFIAEADSFPRPAPKTRVCASPPCLIEAILCGQQAGSEVP